MTTLAISVWLGLMHASVVVLATILARMCIPRRVAAGRATVGAVGMACILGVTAASLLPLPGIWPHASSRPADKQGPNRDLGMADVSDDDSQAAVARRTSSPSDLKPAGAVGVQLPLDWLRRLGSDLERATVATDASSRNWRALVLAILLGGSGISLLRLFLAMRWVQRLRLASSPIVDESIARTVDELKRRCGCCRRIELRETDQLTSAAASGWSRPVILLPLDWSQWSVDELATVLAHEVAHVHRADFLCRLIALVSAAVHFYHPLVRAAARRLAVDQEFAADRLARDLMDDAQAYARGLARLALRYHESFQDRREWSSVSIMPRSSDFLARRLEMLRVKNASTGKRNARLLSFWASTCVVAIALATALLRGATAGEEERTESSPPAAETARRETHKATGPVAPTNPDGSLFSREAFDPATFRFGEKGGFLIRLGDLLRHPDIAPHVDELNKYLFEAVRALTKGPDVAFDLREIEWIAGDLLVSVKAPDEPGGNAKFMFGTGRVEIHMARAADWQKTILQHVSGSSLQEYEGRSYVQLPVLPALGPVAPRMRFPDDRTIVVRLGFLEAGKDAAKEAKFHRTFFDDTPAAHEWANAWRAVDGGLVTLLFDNSQVGWLDLPEEERPNSEFATPLLEKTKYVAVGLDWAEKTNRTGIRMRGTCADHESVKQVHLGAMTLLSSWPAMFLDADDFVVKHHKRILQFFASVKIAPSAADAADHFVHATGDVGWDAGELVEILRSAWTASDQ